MHVIGSRMLSLLYEVYQCILADLKWLQATQTRYVKIIRLYQNIPTTFLDSLIFHMSAGYGIQHLSHIANVTKNQAPIFLNKLCSSYCVIILQDRLLLIFYLEDEILLWYGWNLEGINVYTKPFNPKIKPFVLVSPGGEHVI